MSSFNYLDLCRLCLAKDRASVPIFENEGDVLHLLHKISTCRLPVEISSEDKLPKKICDDCVNKVELFYQFWNTTLNAKEQLLQLVSEASREVKDKLGYEVEVFNTEFMEQEHSSNSRFDDTVMQISEHQSNINMDMFDNMSTITIYAASEQQDTDFHEWRDNEENLSVTEKSKKLQNNQALESMNFAPRSCDESVPSALQQLSEVSEMKHQTSYSDAKTRMLELTIMDPMPLSNFSSYPVPHSPSPDFHEISSPLSYLEYISNSTCSEIPSPTLFLDQLSSSAVPSCFDEFPDPEFITESELLPCTISESEISQSIAVPEFIPNHNLEPEFISQTIPSPVSESPPLPFQEQIVSSSTVDENANEKPTVKRPTRRKSSDDTNPISKSSPKELIIPNKERPRRLRHQHYCHECLIGFSDKVKLGQHMVQEHQIERPFICDECGQSFRSALNINRHKRLHDEEKAKQFSCDHCDYATYQKSNLTMHIKRRHDKNYTFTCQECRAGFMQRTKFLEHLALHQDHSNRHPCNHCVRAFSYKRNLRQHTVEHHPETIPGPIEPKSRIPCPHCNKRFAKEQSLQRHVKAQHTEPSKKIPCTECGAQLSCKSALAQHMRSHRGEKVAVCDICNKGFAKWQNLRVHQRVHTGERPYKCTHCSNAFAQKTTLVHHIRIHTGERPYKCEQCGKGFVSGSLLKKHNTKCQSTPKELTLSVNSEDKV